MSNEAFKKYQEFKAKYPDAVLLFRCGDFYESYGSDATIVYGVCGVVQRKDSTGLYVSGFPHHALDIYLPKIIRAGYRIAICDQLEDPRLTKKLVKRGITEQ